MSEDIKQTVVPGELIRHDMPAIGACVSAAEHEKVVADLKAKIAELELDSQRSALWAAGLSFHFEHIKRAAEAFVTGVVPTPWKTREPRIVGFKLELDEMVKRFRLKAPDLPSREAMIKLNQMMLDEGKKEAEAKASTEAKAPSEPTEAKAE